METSLIETQQEKNELLARTADGLAIVRTDADYERGRQLLADIKEARRAWKELMDPLREQQHKAWKLTCETIKKVDDPMGRAEEKLVGGLGAYESILEAKHKAEQEARAALVVKTIEDAALMEAQALAQSGDTHAADAVLAEASTFKPTVILPKRELNDGISKRVSWHAEVTDLKALVQAVASGALPLSYIEPNMAALNQRARGDKAEMRVPGVVAVPENQYARRAM